MHEAADLCVNNLWSESLFYPIHDFKKPQRLKFERERIFEIYPYVCIVKPSA